MIKVLKEGEEVLWQRTPHDTPVHRPVLLAHVATEQIRNGFISEEELLVFLTDRYQKSPCEVDNNVERRIKTEVEEGFIEAHQHGLLPGYRLTHQGYRLVCAFFVTQQSHVGRRTK